MGRRWAGNEDKTNSVGHEIFMSGDKLLWGRRPHLERQRGQGWGEVCLKSGVRGQGQGAGTEELGAGGRGQGREPAAHSSRNCKFCWEGSPG